MTDAAPRVSRLLVLCVLVLSVLGAAAEARQVPAPAARVPPAGTIQRPAATGFTVEQVAPGVHALIRTKPPGFLSDCNVVFIVNDHDVAVVDTNLTPASAIASIAALRAITTKPVRFVINTHWHVDHVSGNQVYQREFPDVEFIGHRRVKDDLVEKGVANRRDMGEQGRQFAVTMRQQVAEGKSLTGAPLTSEERASYAGDLSLIDELVASMPTIEIVPPTIVVDDRLSLHRGSRVIEILRLGRSHTHGDLVVHLPAEGVMVTGDLVIGPTPLIGGDQSFIGDWATSLDRLLGLSARVYVPGHGPVYRDHSQVTLLRDLLRAVDRHAAAAIDAGETLEQARKTLALDEFRRRMAGEDQALRVLFANYGSGPALTASFREGARSVPDLPSVTLPPDLDRVLRDYERAWKERDAAALAALFADDGFVLSNGRPGVRGRTGIQAHYKGSGGPLTLRALAFSVDGSAGHIVGAFSSEAGQPDIGKFVLALRRRPDGRWLISADIDNSVRD